MRVHYHHWDVALFECKQSTGHTIFCLPVCMIHAYSKNQSPASDPLKLSISEGNRGYRFELLTNKQIHLGLLDTIPVASIRPAEKSFWYLILRRFYVGLEVLSDPTMMAIPADGDHSSNQRPMVSPPNTEGNTWDLDSAPPPIVLQPNPIVLQHGTATAIDNSIANLLSEGFDDDPRQCTHHDIPQPLRTLSPSTPNPPVNPDNLNNIQTSRIDLDALERKICSIGKKID